MNTSKSLIYSKKKRRKHKKKNVWPLGMCMQLCIPIQVTQVSVLYTHNVYPYNPTVLLHYIQYLYSVGVPGTYMCVLQGSSACVNNQRYNICMCNCELTYYNTYIVQPPPHVFDSYTVLHRTSGKTCMRCAFTHIWITFNYIIQSLTLYSRM